ncbi:MAG: energy-coupling factor ABC transporter permease [Synergistaceae bacterium]|jgi:cobalt/nickel transport system permease protein|nr:energy-coupling factor ABC transporter permease [Synergistaceae bacterium]
MHMADALLSPTVSGVMSAVTAGAIVFSASRVKKEAELSPAWIGDRKIPVMGVMGAFVFAAQMINFTIPATGSSGHIAGGILLAAMLGPYAAFLTLASVLVIQCLFFADGGILALGCNIFNMGFISCLIAYPNIFKPIAGRAPDVKKITTASVAASVVGLQIGALGVVLETLFSGVTELPFSTFVLLMQPIHLAIGAVEGIITAAALCFVFQMRPELLDFSDGAPAPASSKPSVSYAKTLLVLLAIAAAVGGGLSLYASDYPDGLEWSMERVAGTTELERSDPAHEAAAKLQESTAFMPDYGFKSDGDEGSALGTSSSGIIGGALTLALAAAVGASITALKKHPKKNDAI